MGIRAILYIFFVLFFSCRYEKDFYQRDDYYTDLLTITVVSRRGDKKIKIKNIISTSFVAELSKEVEDHTRVNIKIQSSPYMERGIEKENTFTLETEDNKRIEVKFKYSLKNVFSANSGTFPVVTITEYSYRIDNGIWKTNKSSFELTNLDSDDKENIKIII